MPIIAVSVQSPNYVCVDGFVSFLSPLSDIALNFVSHSLSRSSSFPTRHLCAFCLFRQTHVKIWSTYLEVVENEGVGAWKWLRHVMLGERKFVFFFFLVKEKES